MVLLLGGGGEGLPAAGLGLGLGLDLLLGLLGGLPLGLGRFQDGAGGEKDNGLVMSPPAINS